MKNQALSAVSAAISPAASARGRLNSFWAESAPAASKTGMAGRGTPSCSTKTQAKSNRYPYINKICVGNSMGKAPVLGRA
jgi:hypothetical protein